MTPINTDQPTVDPDTLADELAVRKDPPGLSLGLLLITSLGLGYVRPASGTWGSLPPFLVSLPIILFAPADTALVLHTVAMLAIIGVFTLACAVYGDEAEARYNGKDPSEAVADEVAGQAVALLPLAFFTASGAHTTVDLVILYAVSFAAFRFFDIIKPPPANALQQVPGGWGIVLDDLIAGVYAAVPLCIAGLLL